MSTAVLTSKGQVTIPAEVRRRRGIDTGSRIEFVEVEGGGFVIKPAVDDVRSLKGLLINSFFLSRARCQRAKPGAGLAIKHLPTISRVGCWQRCSPLKPSAVPRTASCDQPLTNRRASLSNKINCRSFSGVGSKPKRR